MKPLLLTVTGLALAGCFGADLEREYLPHSGVVTAVEIIDVDRLQRQSGTRTSISIGVGVGTSTGGRSAGMGMNFPFGDRQEDRNVVRYEVDLVDDGPIVVYHPRRQYEIDDCVQVRIHPNAKRYPPKIREISDDCGS